MMPATVKVQFPDGVREWPAVVHELRRPDASAPGDYLPPTRSLEPQPSTEWTFFPAGDDWTARVRRRR